MRKSSTRSTEEGRASIGLPCSADGIHLRPFPDRLIFSLTSHNVNRPWRCSSVGQSTRLISAASTVRICPPPPLFFRKISNFSLLKTNSGRLASRLEFHRPCLSPITLLY